MSETWWKEQAQLRADRIVHLEAEVERMETQIKWLQNYINGNPRISSVGTRPDVDSQSYAIPDLSGLAEKP